MRMLTRCPQPRMPSWPCTGTHRSAWAIQTPDRHRGKKGITRGVGGRHKARPFCAPSYTVCACERCTLPHMSPSDALGAGERASAQLLRSMTACPARRTGYNTLPRSTFSNFSLRAAARLALVLVGSASWWCQWVVLVGGGRVAAGC